MTFLLPLQSVWTVQEIQWHLRYVWNEESIAVCIHSFSSMITLSSRCVLADLNRPISYFIGSYFIAS
jgi:hypothetical protein